MKADDVSPNRLEYAKNIIKTFLHNDNKSSIGYIVFSGKAFALSPVTDDRAGILSLVESTQTENLEQEKEWTSWSNIGDALVLAGSLLEKEQWEKEILLLTDGRANIGIDPRIVGLEMQKKWIKISTMPIWSLTGGLLSYKDSSGKRQYFYDEGGKAISAPVDTELLASIARTTGWVYSTGHLLWAHTIPDTKISPKISSVADYKKIPLLYLVLIILIFLHFTVEFSIAKKSLQ
jgi:Ca-activated chloride channel homolog